MIELPLWVGAFFAGVFMFLAPCTLPIVPGYLAFISGVSLADVANLNTRKRARRQVLRNAIAFVLGFSLVFIALGASAGFIGAVLGPWRYTLARIAGGIIILFGLTMLGVLHTSLVREWHIRIPSFLILGRWESSALIGTLFALGWSPCIGPILGTILLIASSEAAALQGALLLGIFSLGLALPFILTALLLAEATLFLQRISGLVRVLSMLGGLFLLALGTLMLLGKMGLLVGWGYNLFDFIGYERLLQYL